MKRNATLLSLMALLLLLSACSLFVNTTADDSAKLFFDAVKNLDLKTAKTLADEPLTTTLSGLESQLENETARAMMEKILSVMEYEILSVSEENQSAQVMVNIRGLSEEALGEITSRLLIAGFSVSDPANVQDVEASIQHAIDQIDMHSLPTTVREMELQMRKVLGNWVFGEEALSQLTKALLPENF